MALIYPGVITTSPNSAAGREIWNSLRRKASWLVAGYAGIALFLAGSECSQYFIETRALNIDDILWGLAGIAAGAASGIWIWYAGSRPVSRQGRPLA